MGFFFDTRDAKKLVKVIPVDADANGAYNIAKKGLWMLKQIRESNNNKINLAISNKEWLKFAQENCL